MPVYGDALAGGWENWSWGSAVNFANTAPARGSRSIAVTYQRDGGLSLHSQTAIDTSGYAAVAFWVRGGGVSAPLQFATEDSNNTVNSNRVAFSAPANAWTPVTVTLAQLGNPASFQRLDFQEAGGGTPAAPYTVYFDDIRLVGSAIAARRGGERAHPGRRDDHADRFAHPRHEPGHVERPGGVRECRVPRAHGGLGRERDPHAGRQL